MKKDSQTIHRVHAEQKARRNRQCGKSGPGQHIGPGNTEPNPLNNPFAQALAFAIRIHNSMKPKKAYERRKV